MSEANLDTVIEKIDNLGKSIVAHDIAIKGLQASQTTPTATVDYTPILQAAMENMDEMAQAKFRSSILATGDEAAKKAISNIPTLKASQEPNPYQEQIDYLTAKHAKPMIDKMLVARQQAGMSESELKAFQEHMNTQNIMQVEQQFKNEAPLIEKINDYQIYEPAKESEQVAPLIPESGPVNFSDITGGKN